MTKQGFTLVRRQKAVLPSIALSKSDKATLMRIGEGSVLQNIKQQKQADGSTLKRNAKSTLKEKRRLGRGRRSLVDEKHRFVQGRQQSWAGEERKTMGGRTSIWIKPATPELRKLNRFVQENGYVGWLGINEKAVKAIRLLLQKMLNREFAKAARKSLR